MTTLADVKPGKKARIIRTDVRGPAGRRYKEMGLIRGEIVKVVRVAPIGDPIEVEVKGYNLSLRKEEARQIIVEVL